MSLDECKIGLPPNVVDGANSPPSEIKSVVERGASARRLGLVGSKALRIDERAKT